MKKTLNLITLALLISFGSAQAEEGKSKKVNTRSFSIERVISVSADKVWNIVGENYADIAKSHPKLSSSHYVENTPLSGEGCERVCNLSEKGDKFTREKIVNYNTSDYSFTAEILEAGGLPLVSNSSYMYYDVDTIDAESCRITLRMVFATDPAFLGAIAKGKFKKNIEDYALAIEHHALTGEDVDPENFKQIKLKYK